MSVTNIRTRSGFMLMDALLGAALFGIFLTAVGSTILIGQQSFLKSGDMARGVFLSTQGLESVRNIRDLDWDLLEEGGPLGVAIGEDGTWEFSGTGSTTQDAFTTSVVLEAIDDNSFLVTSTTNWEISRDRKSSTSVQSLVTNWRKEQTIGDWSSISIEGSIVISGTPLFRNVHIDGQYAFVTGETTAGGNGLYIFDISDTENPQRVASDFSLTGNGHHMVSVGSGLIIVVEQEFPEVILYDISSPSTLSVSDQLDGINVPGDGKAVTVATYNNYVFIGAKNNATEDEFYSYSINGDSLTFLDSFDTDGSLNDIFLQNGYAYMASGDNIAELRVLDVFDPNSIQNAPGNGYNLIDVHDGISIDGCGTGVLLGRMNGGVIEEFILFDTADGAVPSPPPGPFYYEMAGAVQDIECEPGGRDVFVASDFDSKELSVIRPSGIVVGQSAEATYFDAPEMGYGVSYDLSRDRLFFVTSNTLYIFKPGN